MQKVLATLAVLPVIATPAFAQSFDPGNGTDNVLSFGAKQQVRESGPTAPQSIEAQLHHQPTPHTVQNAESKAIADADAALQRARQAIGLEEKL